METIEYYFIYRYKSVKNNDFLYFKDDFNV